MGLFDNYESDSELSDLVYDPTLDKPTRQLAKQVKRMERDVIASGVDPSETTPRESFFMELLDTLDAPRQGLAGVVDAAFKVSTFAVINPE